MISSVIRVFNNFSQLSYDSFEVAFIASMHLVVCPNIECGSVGNFVVHAHYYRYYGYGKQQFRLRVLRIRCKECNTTHAVLPVCIIAYSPFPTDLYCQIIYMKLQGKKSYSSIASSFDIDKRTIKRMVNRFVQEHLDTHLQIFGSLQHLASVTANDCARFFFKTKSLLLVSKEKLKCLHYSLIHSS